MFLHNATASVAANSTASVMSFAVSPGTPLGRLVRNDGLYVAIVFEGTQSFAEDRASVILRSTHGSAKQTSHWTGGGGAQPDNEQPGTLAVNTEARSVMIMLRLKVFPVLPDSQPFHVLLG